VFDGTNFGVGTAAPAVPLEVDKASGEAMRVAATGANQTIHTSYIAGSPSTGNFKVGNDSATGGAFSGLGAYGVLWQAGTNLGIAFGTNNALAMSIEPSGTVILKGGSSSATGVGITFPATQSASTNANTLDDYEEGTWTPSVGGTATYTTQAGTYTKIGRLVHVRFVLTINVIGTGSQLLISGLPFTEATGQEQPGSMGVFSSLNQSVVFIAPYVTGSGTGIAFNILTAAGATATNNPNILQSATQVNCSAVYTTS
jgi:hypothetical protein